ncbi:MAG TPA: SBBP repeat-containing protein [Herpetosiphonaceae bacterium]
MSLLLTAQPLPSLATGLADVPRPPMKPSLANLPIAFVPNVGQTDPSVEFQAQGLGGTLFFTPDQIVLTLPTASRSDQSTDDHSPVALKSRSRTRAAEPASRRDQRAVVRLDFVGANPSPAITSADPLPGIVNYFLGDDPGQWRTNVPTYAAIRYERLYPGIDLRYDGKGGRLKGTYFVAAGANPSRIRWRYQGATAVTVDQSGNLVVSLAPHADSQAGSTLVEEAPIAWQTVDGRQVPVQVRYTVAPDQTIGFTIGTYDRTLPLVLDPTLDYSTYVGSSGDDTGRSIAVDGDGEVYITGDTNSLSFPITNTGTLTDTNQGGTDAFVVKLNPAGSQALYSSFIGGENTDVGNGIAVDSAGNAFIVGSTASVTFPRVNPYDLVFNGATDIFVTQLDTAGAITYSTYLGGSFAESGNSITVDSTHNIYITGETESDYFLPATNPDSTPILGYSKTLRGIADAFVIKLKSDKMIAYGTYLGGSLAEASSAITIDGNGFAYVTGYTSSTDYPRQNSFLLPTVGGIDAFVTKLAADGRTLVYSTFFGGSSNDFGTGIVVDADRSAYVTGYTSSLNFPVANYYQKTLKGNNDAFVTKISAIGNSIVYSTYLGGTSDDYGQGIVVDRQKSIYLIGYTASGDFPNDNALQATRNGGTDTFVTQLKPNGTTIEYSTYFGGTSNDYGQAIAAKCELAGPCTLYITGITASKDFPTTAGSSSPGYHEGLTDIFVARLGPPSTGPRLYLHPPLKFIGTNQELSVEIKVDTGGADIDTVDAYLQFPKEHLEVIEVVPITPTNITNLQIYRTFDNAAGRVDFSATTLERGTTLPDQFTAATVRFRTTLLTTNGSAPATISFIEKERARRSNLYFEGTAVPAAPSTLKLESSNIRILSGALLNGKISLEGRGAPSTPGWITPLFREHNGLVNGGIVVYDPADPTNQTVLGYFATTTDNNGRFSILLEGINGGKYPVQIKGADTLSNIRQADLDTSDLIEFGTLCTGDSTGDDMINGADVSYMVPSYQLESSHPNFLPYGNANKDGLIDRADVLAVKENFLKTGVISETNPLACRPPALSSTNRSAAAQPLDALSAAPENSPGTVERPTLRLYPENQTVFAGQVFTVSLQVDLKSTVADTIDAFLDVMPNELTFVDKDGNPIKDDALQGEIELDVAGLGNTSCEPTYNDIRSQSIGTANASVTCFRQPFLPNQFTLATFRLKADSSTDQATITLKSTPNNVRQSNLYRDGNPIDSLRTNATVEVLKLAGEIFVPIVRK